MRRISPAGEFAGASDNGSATGGVRNRAGPLSVDSEPLPRWLASVDMGLEGARRPDRSAEPPEIDNSMRDDKDSTPKALANEDRTPKALANEGSTPKRWLMKTRTPKALANVSPELERSDNSG